MSASYEGSLGGYGLRPRHEGDVCRAELQDGRGGVIHVTEAYPTKGEAFAAAREWLSRCEARYAAEEGERRRRLDAAA